MSKGKGVSGNTHSQQQLNDYAKQNNPNNSAYQAIMIIILINVIPIIQSTKVKNKV